MESSKLSVVMTNYNHGLYIAEALDAIVQQTYEPLEIIVCDDASTDDSVKIIQSFVDRYPFVHMVRNEINLGAVASVNKVIPLTSGDYLYWGAADDKVLPGFFEKTIRLLLQYPQAGLCSTCTLCVDAQGRNKGVLHMPVFLGKNNFISPDKVLSLLYKHGSWMQGNTVIFRKCALIDSGGFIPELHSSCDGFIHQVIAVKYGVCFVPEPLTKWRQLKNSYSAIIAKDFEMSLKWIRYAKQLMNTTYRDLFPPDFVNYWEKKELINFHLSRLYSLQDDVLNDLKQLSFVRSSIDRHVFGLRRLLAKIDYFILKSYLYHRSGLSTNQLFIQKIRMIWNSIFTRRT